jgi:hypothetical protein
MLKKLIPLLLICVFLSSCVTTNFSKTNLTASIEEEYVRKELFVWSTTRVLSVENIYPADGDNGNVFTFDAGQKRIGIYYVAREVDTPKGGYGLHSDVIYFDVDLKPNGKYKVTSEYFDKMVILRVLDAASNTVIKQSAKIPVRLLPLKNRSPYSTTIKK